MTARRSVGLAVLVSALGYFVDAYDLILFSILRVTSLTDLGVRPQSQLAVGVMLLNMQLAGLLLGGLVWGVLGDKRGRLSVLFGSIFIYSAANLANAAVSDIPTYALCRFVAGFGLAGELGAGVTLVSELMPKHARGYGTTIIATTGVLGVVAAALCGDVLPWRAAYASGGGLGLLLLVVRVGVVESDMFRRVRSAHVSRGNFGQLVTQRQTALKYLRIILLAVPIWFSIGILLTFSPELAQALGLAQAPRLPHTILWFYVGFTAGDLGSGLMSQALRSRRKVVLLFLCLVGLCMLAYPHMAARSLSQFYIWYALLGLACGYWAVFVTMASEQFGTNLRATAATTAPNFVRASALPLSYAVQASQNKLGLVNVSLGIGFCTILVALWALRGLEESFGRDLDYLEGVNVGPINHFAGET